MNERNAERAVDKAGIEERWKSITPLGRMGTTDEVAATVLYLASDEASYCNGTSNITL